MKKLGWFRAPALLLAALVMGTMLVSITGLRAADGAATVTPAVATAAVASATSPAASSAATSSAAARPTSVPAGVTWLRDVEYAKVGEKRLLLDLYIPEKFEGRLPVIVWVHGGGWSAGNKFPCPASWLSAHGYAVASVSYRFSQEAIFPAQIHDCSAAVRWLRANADKYQFDPLRLGAFGASAGGHLVALLGVGGGVKELEGQVGDHLGQSSRVQAVCDEFGPADFTQAEAVASVASDTGDDKARLFVNTVVHRLLGGTPEEFAARAKAASVTTYVTKDDPPFLIMHGDRDPLVNLRQSVLLDEALKKAGVNSTLHVVKGAGHGFGGPVIKKTIEDFFALHLKPKTEIKAPPASAAQPPSPATASTPAPASTQP